jgi:hypothetical protein
MFHETSSLPVPAFCPHPTSAPKQFLLWLNYQRWNHLSHLIMIIIRLNNFGMAWWLKASPSPPQHPPQPQNLHPPQLQRALPKEPAGKESAKTNRKNISSKKEKRDKRRELFGPKCERFFHLLDDGRQGDRQYTCAMGSRFAF